MDWNTVLGAALAIAGGLVAQLLSDRRAAAREARARRHEAEVWARGLRYEAHVSFLSAVDAKLDALTDIHNTRAYEPEPDVDYLAPVWDHVQSLRLVCTAETATEAHNLFRALSDVAYSNKSTDVGYRARDRYLAAVRTEFGLPELPAIH